VRRGAVTAQQEGGCGYPLGVGEFQVGSLVKQQGGNVLKSL